MGGRPALKGWPVLSGEAREGGCWATGSPPGDRQGRAHKGQGQAEESPECQLELTLH